MRKEKRKWGRQKELCKNEFTIKLHLNGKVETLCAEVRRREASRLEYNTQALELRTEVPNLQLAAV